MGMSDARSTGSVSGIGNTYDIAKKIEIDLGYTPRTARFIAHVSLINIQCSNEGLVDRLVKQICGTVRWRESLIKMADEYGIKNFFEIGPGKVLASTVKRTIPDANVLSVGLAPQIDQALEIIND